MDQWAWVVSADGLMGARVSMRGTRYIVVVWRTAPPTVVVGGREIPHPQAGVTRFGELPKAHPTLKAAHAAALAEIAAWEALRAEGALRVLPGGAGMDMA